MHGVIPSGTDLAAYCGRQAADGPWDMWADAAYQWIADHAVCDPWTSLHETAALELGKWLASLRGQGVTGNVVVGDFGAAYIGQHVPAVGKLLTVTHIPGVA